jgi:hypothetical protein
LDSSFRFGTENDGGLQVLWAEAERVLCRGWRLDADGNRSPVLAVLPATEHPPRSSLDCLAHEYAMKDELDAAWAARPLALERAGCRTMLVLEDPGGELLARRQNVPMEVNSFLRLAIGIATCLAEVHNRGLVHKDIKPANMLVNGADGQVWLTGFGIASRLPRQRQAPEPPETIAGTLAYMAPEQTGRMKRSIDARSDLYSLGITLYQMLTGQLPFTASDPMEWVHCQIARRPVPPGERLANVPSPVSQIIMNGVPAFPWCVRPAGTSAGAVPRRSAMARRGHARAPDRFLVAETLYGRARGVEALTASFDRVISSGASELLLVARYAGIGKSAVVHELHKALAGPGLASATLNLLLEAFYTTKPGGLGMGPSICRSIIEAHGGRLWADVNQPLGAVFQFVLPVQR